MLQSIFVYSFIIISLYIFSQIPMIVYNDKTIKTFPDNYNYMMIVLGILIFAFFAGVRWDVGIDHLEYWREYNRVGMLGHTFRTDMEIGFVFIMELFNKIGLHFAVFFATIAFLQLSFTYLGYKDNKYIIPYLGVLIMCGGDFFSWMNGMRQTLVSCFIVFIIPFTVLKKRILLFLLCLFIASYIHKSAFLMVILYPLTYLKLETFYVKKNIQYILFFSALFLSSLNVWQSMLEQTDSLLQFIGYGDRFNMDVIEENTRQQNFGARKIIFLIIDLAIIFYSDKMRSAYKTKLFGLSYIMFIVLYVTQPIFLNSATFSRITAYFYIYRAIISSYLLFYLFKVDRTRANKLIGTFIILLYILHLFIQIYTDSGGHTSCIKYQFIWDAVTLI